MVLKTRQRTGGILKHLGPGLIITACIVGSGELIATPKVGAEYGFSLLWFIIAGCMIKVLVQVELGRFAISKGMTTLEAMNTMPGPRFIVSWLVWCWLFMFVGPCFNWAESWAAWEKWSRNWDGCPENTRTALLR